MEPDISPLAKRLAEENNVDWRGLGGSGANGRIVERDVLEYLAKVMAGEEDVNPTAEPVPEGMEAWPEEDTAGYFSESSPSLDTTDTLTEVVTDQPSVVIDEKPGIFDAADDPVLAADPVAADSAADVFAHEAEEVMVSTFAPEEAEEVSDVHISEDIFLFDEESDADGAEAAMSGEAFDTFDADNAVEAATFEEGSGRSAAPDELFAETEAAEEAALFEDAAPKPRSQDAAEVFEPIAGISAETEGDEAERLGGFDVAEDVAPVVAPANLPLTTYGVLLRRHAELGAAVQAQLAVSHELGQSDPIRLDSLLLRAAAKALQSVDIANGQDVGLVTFASEGVEVFALPGAHETPFRTLVEQVAAPDAAGQAGLAVADMSDLGIDEAVLNLEIPVLALGRILQDSEEGTHHSTLTLSGSVPVEAGTRFLSAVAELLASPVRLVL